MSRISDAALPCHAARRREVKQNKSVGKKRVREWPVGTDVWRQKAITDEGCPDETGGRWEGQGGLSEAEKKRGKKRFMGNQGTAMLYRHPYNHEPEGRTNSCKKSNALRCPKRWQLSFESLCEPSCLGAVRPFGCLRGRGGVPTRAERDRMNPTLHNRERKLVRATPDQGGV